MREILAAGSAAQPPPPTSSAGSHKGRQKQSKAKNLLDALMARAEQVLALLDDLRIPFTNNQAERDLRWAKVQQKIAGTFRSATGGHRFLPHPQVSFDDAEARTSYALCSDCCLPWSTFTGRLGA